LSHIELVYLTGNEVPAGSASLFIFKILCRYIKYF